MTCRDFMDAAELLTPSQLLRLPTEEQPLSAHANECRSCREWMDSHRVLGNAFSALSSDTGEQQAGPEVERALIQFFRQQEFGAQVVVMPKPAAASLWTLSRIFEYGAYAAVAAALAVGVFLGVRVLRDQQSKPATVQATVTAPQTSSPITGTTDAKSRSTEHPAVGVAEKEAREVATQNPAVAVKRTSPAATKAEANTSETAGYVPLMLCDPLICSGDEQVIRMELPAGSASDGSAGQPVLADVVIGEDGLVRRMRIVN